jgi:eukaryotic-like serine/threonine-protein kinase
MMVEKWQIVKQRFNECLSLAPESREAFLAECAIPDDVRAEVSRLLRNLDESDPGFLEPPEVVRRTFQASHALLRIGDILANRFHIERFIGSGGMGEVYQATDMELDESVALKILRPLGEPSSESSARFRRELLLARRVTNPHVCRLFDLSLHKFPWGEVEFLTMELLDGITLSELLKQKGRIEPTEATSILRQILLGLEAAHSAGVIHRDLKPGNVMVTPADSNSFRVVLTDFGLARIADASSAHTSLTASGDLLGTLAYISPEQLTGDSVTPSTDYYAFGLIWLEMLTGERPFKSDGSVADALKRLQRPVAIPDSLAIPLRWRKTIQACLERDPADRPSSAGAILDALDSSGKRFPIESSVRRYVRVHRRQFLIGGGSVTFVSVGMTLFRSGIRLFDQSTKLPEGVIGLVAPIANSTGEPTLNAVTELFRNQLTQSVHLNLLENARLASTLRQMGKNPEASGSADLREAGWRQNAGVILFGGMTRVGTDYVLNVQLETRGSEPQNPRAKVLKSFSAPDAAGLMRAVHDAGRWVRETIGESAANISAFDRLPGDVTTPSWEALSFYARGEQLSAQHNFEDALLMMESALQRDPQFTLAALRRADLLMNRFRQREGLRQWRAAIQMLDVRAVTRREELNARGMYAFDTGDLAAADRYFASWALEYPNDPRGTIYRTLPLLFDGHAEEARANLERVAQTNPTRGAIFLELVNCNLVLGRVDAARSWIARFRRLARRPGPGGFEGSRGTLS